VWVSVLDNACVSSTSSLKKRDKWKSVKEIRETDKGAAVAGKQQRQQLLFCLCICQYM